MNTERKMKEARNRDLLSSIFVATLVRIINYNPSKMTVDVQPLVKNFTPSGWVDPSPIMEVPISLQMGGGFLSRHPFKEGDLGHVVFLDNDIDSTLSTGGLSQPNTERMHSDTDAVFVGSLLMGNHSIAGVPEDGYVISTLDGDTYIQVTDSGINMKGKVSVDGDITVDGTVSANNI